MVQSFLPTLLITTALMLVLRNSMPYIRDACLFMDKTRIDQVVFETDSQNVVMFINDRRSQVHWSGKLLVEEIRKF